MSFVTKKYYNTASGSTGTTLSVIIPTIDLRGWDKFCVTFQNSNTAISFMNLTVQVALDASATAADSAPNWIGVNTTTLPVPSALAPTAITMTSAVDNVYAYMRVLAGVSAGLPSGSFVVTVAGFQKFTG